MATGIMAILLIAVVLCFPVRVHAHVMKWHKLSWMPQKLTYRFYYRSYRNLVGLGPGAEPALEALIEGFRLETHPTGRRKYLDIFRAMGPAAEPVIPELIAELTAKRNVNSVAGVIESIGVVNPEVVEALRSATRDGISIYGNVEDLLLKIDPEYRGTYFTRGR